MTDTQRTYYIITGRDSHDAPYQLSVSDEDKEFRYILSAFRVSAAAPISSTEALTAVMAHAAGRDIMLATVTQLIPRPATADKKLDAARSVLRADYWQDVQSVVADVKDAITRGDITDTDDATQRIDELCDQHQRVIYTGQAIECLLFSPNDSAYDDEIGGEAENWSVRAFYAFRADVMEELGDIEALLLDSATECYWCDSPITEDDDRDCYEDRHGTRHATHATCPDEAETCADCDTKKPEASI